MRATITARGPVATAILTVAFLAIALTTRLPFRDKTLFISDSVRYALASGVFHKLRARTRLRVFISIEKKVDKPCVSAASAHDWPK